MIIKNIFFKLINIISYLLSLIFNKNILVVFLYLKKRTCWYAYKRKFNEIGIDSLIMWPFYIRGMSFVKIGNNFHAGHDLTLEALHEHNGIKYSPNIVIGDNVTINSYCHIGCINKITIESGVLIASKVFITDHTHGKTTIEDMNISPNKRPLFSKGGVFIKKNAWIGECVSIMSGVTIGENSIIGANSVVTKDIPDNSIAAGAPARIIKRVIN